MPHPTVRAIKQCDWYLRLFVRLSHSLGGCKYSRIQLLSMAAHPQSRVTF